MRSIGMTPSEDVPGDVPLGPQLSGVRTARADAATVRRSTCKLAEIDHLRCFWFFRDITKFHLNAKQHVNGEIWWNSQ